MPNDETDSLLAGSDKKRNHDSKLQGDRLGIAFVVIHRWPLVAFKSTEFFATTWE